MKVENVKVYDLEESLIASGLPMKTETHNTFFSEKDIKRAERLVRAMFSQNNPAHVQFLTGIRVNFDLTFSNKAWVEAERYRFLEFVSSQSTMHRITKFDLDNQYNKYVDPRIITIIKEKIKEYEILKQISYDDSIKQKKHEDNLREKYLEILYSNPAGFELTARMTTNYRCLLNIYIQRHDHRLPEWREFCKWIRELPYMNIFIEVWEKMNKEGE